MSLEPNLQYVAAVKQEYLPPPLENNYLSLFDIQAKMAQEFLHGTDEEKIATIKKRIKKFFDYGNDLPVDNDLTNEACLNKKSQYPPFEVKENFHFGLKIFPSQVILYSKNPITSEIAEKLMPGFIGQEKIDDCNLKLIFVKEDECKKRLKQITKDTGIVVTDHIMNPSEIEWFEVEMKAEDDEDNQNDKPTFYARYATNKDDILFQNDKYFRKLLGRARHLIDKKQQDDEKREKQLRQKAEKKALIEQRRKFTVKRYDDKHYSKDFDTMTNYDGIYSERPYQKYDNSKEACFYESREEPEHIYPGERFKSNKKKFFDDLDISQIEQSDFYQKGQYEYNPPKRDFHRSYSRESIDLTSDFQKKRRPQEIVEDPREKIIKAYREKSGPKNFRTNRFQDSSDYDREYERRIEKSNKPRYHVDDY